VASKEYQEKGQRGGTVTEEEGGKRLGKGGERFYFEALTKKNRNAPLVTRRREGKIHATVSWLQTTWGIKSEEKRVHQVDRGGVVVTVHKKDRTSQAETENTYGNCVHFNSGKKEGIFRVA